ncbi:hypothetical protein RHGRI_034102 [Rhododendron griersonianum]|uniref:Pentatricopeptide repeat-containing protein n=1 Tax=Rhododendron griersonianum TaxID=479676 RepID=A0AAV6I4W6_9ERIC|nr:hypothetical protein RHGRI_034102 [Rhododendron griersonianum]
MSGRTAPLSTTSGATPTTNAPPRVGIQAHCLIVKTGYLINVYVGSSLISFYCKCSELRYAYKVFDEMPVRNVVSWTKLQLKLSGAAAAMLSPSQDMAIDKL